MTKNLLAALVAGIVSLVAFEAFACEAGYCVQSTYPADGAVDVPIDAKIFVFFDNTPGLDQPETGIALFEKDSGQGVLTSVEVAPGGNPTAEVRNEVAIVEPLVPLAPNTTYVVDFDLATNVCAAPSLEFTTGTTTAQPAQFLGATAASAQCFREPAELNSCNDQEPYPRLAFRVAAAPGTRTVAYAVYQGDVRTAVLRPTLPAVVQLLPDEVDAEECFVLRAVGRNGVEDANQEEVCVQTAAVCAPITPPMDADPDMGTVDAGGPSDDAGVPVSDMGTPDAGSPSDDAGGDPVDSGAGGQDGGDRSDSGSAEDEDERKDGDDSGGCSCSTAATPPAMPFILLLGFVAARLRPRRRA